MAKSIMGVPSEEMAAPPENGAITNDVLLAGSEWPLAFDVRNNHMRCARCRQSIMSLGKNGVGYTGNVQTMLGLVVMHMIQAHKYTREGPE